MYSFYLYLKRSRQEFLFLSIKTIKVQLRTLAQLLQMVTTLEHNPVRTCRTTKD